MWDRFTHGRPINKRGLKEYGGEIKFRGEVKVKWTIEYDDGKINSIIIHNVNYIPEAPIWLLLPHKEYQQESNNHPKPDGTWWSTNTKNCTLYWEQERYKCTIPIYPSINNRWIRSVPSDNTYCVFVIAMEENLASEEIEHVCFDTLTDYDEDYSNKDLLEYCHTSKIENSLYSQN